MGIRKIHKKAMYKDIEVFVDTCDDEYYYVTFIGQGHPDKDYMEYLMNIGKGGEYAGKIRKDHPQLYIYEYYPEEE